MIAPFWAIVVEARRTSMDQLLAAIVDFVRPWLRLSQQPEEMYAWTASVGDFHLACPVARRDFRQDAEYLEERLGKLPGYFIVEHERAFDRFIEWNGNRNRELDIEQLEPRTGLTLTMLHAALWTPRRVMLISRGEIVLPGVAGFGRRARSPAQEVDKTLAEISATDPTRFQGDLPMYARRLADLGKPARVALSALLATPALPPRHARVAMAALARLGGEPAARAIAPSLARASKVVQQAARAALARLGEDARAVVTAGAASKKAQVKTASVALEKVLDGEAFADLRRVRALRDAVPATLRAELSKLIQIDARDAEAELRRQRRDDLLRTGDAGTLAWYLVRLQEHPGGSDRLALGLLRGFRDTPLAAWAVALVLIEDPIPEYVYGNHVGDQQLIEEATAVFGAPFKALVTSLRRQKLLSS